MRHLIQLHGLQSGMKQDKKNLRKVYIRLLPSTTALITQGREIFAPLRNIFKNTKIWEGKLLSSLPFDKSVCNNHISLLLLNIFVWLLMRSGTGIHTRSRIFTNILSVFYTSVRNVHYKPSALHECPVRQLYHFQAI